MATTIFITGGTFDKEYNELDGSLFFRKSHLPEILKIGRNRVPLNIKNLMMIDSLCMTDKDRDLIADNILKTKAEKIIITHGTDTIIETSKVLASKIKNKTIVLVGAMIPYKLGFSDSLFNLGTALAFVQTLPTGVYIAMNGQYFTYDNCCKNKNAGFFEKLA